MKKILLLVTVLVLVAGVASAQVMKYQYAGPFPDTTTFKLPWGVVNVGLGVDPDGKVWIQSYQSNLDSVLTPSGYVKSRPIYVFNPDGSQPLFSPIVFLSGPDETGATYVDTLKGRSGYGGNINRANGNFVGVWSGPRMWEINYKTGEGVRTTNLAPFGTNSPASVATNTDGELFLTQVVGGPGQIFNPDFTVGTQFAAACPAIGRAIEVSPNGNDVYVPRFTSAPPTIWVYHSDNGSLGPYTLKDSLLPGWSVETIAINPKTGILWVAADRRSDSTYLANYTANSFYGINLATKAVVDSFSCADIWPAATTLPRGMAFSPTGDTVYVGHFDNSAVPAVARFILGPASSVEQVDNTVPQGFALQQNFPNPFNPSTEIRFDIGTAGFTTLRVYDMLGREVAQLVNQDLPAGTFTATFDASSLPSGTYVYEVVSGSVRLTKKMMLLK